MPPERPEIERPLDEDRNMRASAWMHPDGIGPSRTLFVRMGSEGAGRCTILVDFTAEQLAGLVAWGQEALAAGYGPEAAALSPGDQDA
jgi:hypothetical protein